MAKAHNHAALVMQMYHISHGHVHGGQTMLKTALYSASLCGSMEAPAAAVTHTCRGCKETITDCSMPGLAGRTLNALLRAYM